MDTGPDTTRCNERTDPWGSEGILSERDKEDLLTDVGSSRADDDAAGADGLSASGSGGVGGEEFGDFEEPLETRTILPSEL